MILVVLEHCTASQHFATITEFFISELLKLYPPSWLQFTSSFLFLHSQLFVGDTFEYYSPFFAQQSLVITSANYFILNPLSAEYYTTCHFMALVGAHHILHVSGIRVKFVRHILFPSHICATCPAHLIVLSLASLTISYKLWNVLMRTFDQLFVTRLTADACCMLRVSLWNVTWRLCPEPWPRLAAFPGRKRLGFCGWTCSRCREEWRGRGPADLVWQWSYRGPTAAPWPPGSRCSWSSRRSDTGSQTENTFTDTHISLISVAVCTVTLRYIER